MNLWGLIKDSFTGNLFDDIILLLQSFQQATSDIIETMFFLENATIFVTSGTITPHIIQKVFNILYLSMVGLVALKLCWQGWKVYVLGRDGEAEVAPTTMLTNSLFAVGVALAFPVLYKIGVEIALGISSAATKVFPNSFMAAENIVLSELPVIIRILYNDSAQDFAFCLLLLVYCIIFIILFFKMLFKGVELLLYRLGVPFAVVGLVNSDGGIWKTYIQIYFQQLILAMIQNFCIRLSLVMLVSASGSTLSSGSMIFAIVFLVTAFSAPKIFSSILQQPSGGGGKGTQIMYTVMLAARAFGGV